ncbi:MAG: RNA-binding domain-containing protein [Nitrosopumilus sp.]
MNHKIEIEVELIVHATEDVTKILQSFEEILNIKEDEFTVKETTGHYENPIKILKAKIVKKQAQELMKVLASTLSSDQVNKLIEEIEERTIDSRLHMRLDKQDLINGNLKITEKEPIKFKIYTPVYNKKDTLKSFTEVFQVVN